MVDKKEQSEINFVAIGRNVLIELEKPKNRIVQTLDQKDEDVIESDEAVRIASISEEGIKACGLKVGDWVYIDVNPIERVVTEDKRYATIQIHEIVGYAPNGFDRETWEKNREANQKKIISAKAIMRKNSKGVSAH